jgi:hypothetical protein
VVKKVRYVTAWQSAPFSLDDIARLLGWHLCRSLTASRLQSARFCGAGRLLKQVLRLDRRANDFPNAAHVFFGGKDVSKAETHHDAAA